MNDLSLLLTLVSIVVIFFAIIAGIKFKTSTFQIPNWLISFVCIIIVLTILERPEAARLRDKIPLALIILFFYILFRGKKN